MSLRNEGGAKAAVDDVDVSEMLGGDPNPPVGGPGGGLGVGGGREAAKGTWWRREGKPGPLIARKSLVVAVVPRPTVRDRRETEGQASNGAEVGCAV